MKLQNGIKRIKVIFFNKNSYKNFLYDIGYIVKENEDFKIQTSNIDVKSHQYPGPQLVVPLSNKRYAINAANSRWGSLYDALYGTDIIPNKGKYKITKDYNESRGKEVIKFAKNHLNSFFPVKNFLMKRLTKIQIINAQLIFYDKNHNTSKLLNPNQFKGYIGIKLILKK